MKRAYSWAITDLYHLKMTLDINRRTQLILEIEKVVDRYINSDLESGDRGLFEDFSGIFKENFLKDLDDLVRQYIPDETNDKNRKSIGLRLWSGCLSAAKTIALETRDGQNTPNERTKTFQILDYIADLDPIYCAGVKSAPLFKKERQQFFSFNGVPLTSPVRQNPNEYLVNK